MGGEESLNELDLNSNSGVLKQTIRTEVYGSHRHQDDDEPARRGGLVSLSSPPDGYCPALAIIFELYSCLLLI